jgi:thioesterase domain-containing protein/acyl carrier protein
LPVDLARDLSVRVADLWNVYGPTETTVWSTTCRVGSTSLLTSIGRAIANTRVYVLDDQRHLVPRGCVGQLWIGGMGVARGYRNRPELTVEKFVLDPFSGEAGSRMYATGDLARWSGDGTLECLGRIDRQVKIRGLRIELEEIETILRMQPGVAEVAVTVAGEASQMTERLVAHVVADPGVTLDRDALRQALRSQLPDYMVPVVLPPLAALPLTSSGKIDRRALSQLIDATADLVPCESRRPPATPSELALARIWRDLLNCDTVDCDTSFFALGGHSLLAVRLFHQIERDLGVRLPLESLFHHPTLGGLADLVDRSQSSAGTHATRQSLIQPLRSGEDPCPLFLLPSGGGNLLLWRPLVESVPEGLPVIGLQPVRDAAGSPVWNSLVESVTAMCDAVDRCQPTGPLHLMGYSAGAYMAQELARQLEDRGREVRFLGLIDTGPADYQPHWTDPFRDLGNFVRNLGYWVADNNHRVSWRNLRRRVNALRQQCGWQPSVEAMPNEHQFAQSHFLRILERHSTRTVRAPITLFRARCFPPWQYRPPCLGWTHVGCRVEVVEFPGVDHFDIVAEQHWPKLAAAIVRHLAREQPLDSQTGPRPNLDR